MKKSSLLFIILAFMIMLSSCSVLNRTTYFGVDNKQNIYSSEHKSDTVIVDIHQRTYETLSVGPIFPSFLFFWAKNEDPNKISLKIVSRGNNNLILKESNISITDQNNNKLEFLSSSLPDNTKDGEHSFYFDYKVTNIRKINILKVSISSSDLNWNYKIDLKASRRLRYIPISTI